MPAHGSVARSARLSKEQHPERYCPARGCLWQIRDGYGRELAPCRKHPEKREAGRLTLPASAP